MNDGVKEEIEKYNLELIGVVFMDELIYEYDFIGIFLVNLFEDLKFKVVMKEIFVKLELK